MPVDTLANDIATYTSKFRVSGQARSNLRGAPRAETKLTRYNGACARCRKKKIRCGQLFKETYLPCKRCKGLSPELLFAPCCREDILDIKLFRIGSPSRRNPTVVNHHRRCLHISHDVTKTSFILTVSRYEPGPADTTAYEWTDKTTGRSQSHDLPPYYISDIEEAVQNIRRYAPKSRLEFIQEFLKNSSPIIQKTFAEAIRYYDASKSPFIGAVLTFWSMTRMIERFWVIVGPDTLGVPRMEQDIGPCRRNLFQSSVPVTPFMDTQLDEITIRRLLIPWSKKLLSQLKRKVLPKHKKDWYEIYLATFILLHNAEQVLHHLSEFADRYGVDPAPRANDESSLSQAYYHACKVLLVHYHFIAGGSAPFNLDNLDQNAAFLDEAQMRYLQDMKSEVNTQRAELENLKTASMYGTELYWCHQMFCPEWQPDMRHEGPMLGLTEKDFLVS